ncbi:DNA-3-methyladenine glycosylase [Janibacter sp. G56]|uniref:DNA-3-methyladenine glycosylase n=1 Tax=Janibacter sp. G56 TaxID=3418717 RepID=UPI003D05C0F8
MAGTGRRVDRDFFDRPVLEVAPDLLGRHLSHGGVTVRITETEAYAGDRDAGSHAYRGMTPRTRPMFGPAGFVYAYFTYGNHWMLCLVTGEEGRAAAVLVRAGEVIDGHDAAIARRGDVPDVALCRGPGNLARALGIEREHTGRDFCVPVLGEPCDLVVRAGTPSPSSEIRTGPRVGVSGPGGDGAAFPWRFFLAGEPSVSAYRPGVGRTRR